MAMHVSMHLDEETFDVRHHEIGDIYSLTINSRSSEDQVAFFLTLEQLKQLHCKIGESIASIESDK